MAQLLAGKSEVETLVFNLPDRICCFLPLHASDDYEECHEREMCKINARA
jgi:hypothetical protein